MSPQPEPFELLVVTIRVDKDDADEREDDKQQKANADNEPDVICNQRAMITHSADLGSAGTGDFGGA